MSHASASSHGHAGSLPKWPVAILGGTGFIGQALIGRWPADERPRLRLIVHRSRPSWIEPCGVSVCPSNDSNLLEALSGSATVINLLRPSGNGTMRSITAMLASGLADIGVRRLIHCSSIDVYGSANAAWIDEDVLPEPRTDYAREQLAAEACVHAAPIETCVVRLGAVFGAGGRNMVSIAHEARHAPLSKLIARRALYGDRRMHLVSVEKVADVLRFLALSDHWFDRERILVTDDDASENNFAFVQDELLKSFGRPTLSWVPSLPSQVLSLGLRILGRANTDPTRRISSKKLTALGFHPSVTFRERLERYAECSGSAGEDGIQ